MDAKEKYIRELENKISRLMQHIEDHEHSIRDSIDQISDCEAMNKNYKNEIEELKDVINILKVSQMGIRTS
jgi:septal ring factor EnvC (AmiA/AmiB activator)